MHRASLSATPCEAGLRFQLRPARQGFAFSYDLRGRASLSATTCEAGLRFQLRPARQGIESLKFKAES